MAAIRYSASAILIGFILSVTACFIPVLLGLKKRTGDMVAGGSNSLVLSAACHVFTNNTDEARSQNSSGGSRPESCEDAPDKSNSEEFSARDARQAIARSRLRWGVIPLPSGLASLLQEEQNGVHHLGFGTEEQNVSPPQEGELYI